MTIGIGNDHRGYELKNELIEYLKKQNYNVKDLGSKTTESTDYPIYAVEVGEAVVKKEIDLGILICRTGIGMSIACNKVKGVRCGKVDSIEDARLCRIDNNCNVISVSYEKSLDELKEIINTFINTKFTNEERHARRVNMIKEYEEKC